jgi:multicomponent Na+:H+ antiporter subunit G
VSAALDAFTVVAVCAGALLFLAGSVGLLRFPDAASRVHALSKADSLGLGLVVLGLVAQAGDLSAAGRLVLVWGIAALSGATVAQLLAGAAARAGTRR